MTSVYLSFLVILLVAASAAYAFSPVNTRQTTRQNSSHYMGIFDGIAKAFSNEEYGEPPDAVKATARHILVPTLDDANKVLGELSENSFDSLAQKYSTCPSKSRGGSLGSFSPGTMVKEFDDVVFSPDTKVGVVMGPVQTQFGYHLITVDKRSGGGDWY